MKAILFLSALALGSLAGASTVPAPDFSWDAATVYFLITDRFANGDPTNDVNYGRITDYGSERLNAATWTDTFYMTGDFANASIDYKFDYADAGFSSMVNCFFPKRGDLDGIVYTWQAYSDSIAAHPGWHPFSYLNNSYHREVDIEKMEECAVALLLA